MVLKVDIPWIEYGQIVDMVVDVRCATFAKQKSKKKEEHECVGSIWESALRYWTTDEYT